MSLLVDKVNYYFIYANISILVTEALFVMKFSPYTEKITEIMILVELFSNLIPTRKNLPPVQQENIKLCIFTRRQAIYVLHLSLS